MARLIAFDVLFLLVPFAVYAAWLFMTRGTIRSADDWTTRVIAYLAIAGAVLMVIAIIVFVSFERGDPGQSYVPARIENGTIVPGRFE